MAQPLFSTKKTDLQAIANKKEVAHLGGETSNRLFQTLEEWDDFLKQFAPFFKSRV